MDRSLCLALLLGCGQVEGEPLNPTPLHPSSGVLLYEHSLIDPWCGAVLIAHDRVLTSAHCVEEVSRSGLQFTLGDQRSPEDPWIQAVEVQSALAVLTLDAPLDAAPVESGGDSSQPLTLVTSGVARQHQPFERAMVEGAPVDGPPGVISVRFPPRTVRCHGEIGTGLYAGDRLIGIGVGGFAVESADGCLDVLTFAPAR